MKEQNIKLPDLTQSQRDTLTAIGDTFVATLTPEEKVALLKSSCKIPNTPFSPEQISIFSDADGSSLCLTDRVEAKLKRCLSPSQYSEFQMVLNLLASPIVMFGLSGHWSAIKDLNRFERERVLLKWKRSSLFLVRRIYISLMAVSISEAYFPTDTSLFEGLRYPGVLGETEVSGETIEHDRFEMMDTKEATECDYFDAIVVGSGAGGGVAAAELAKAGLSVLVIEKAKYFHQDEFRPEEDYHAFTHMFENSGVTPSSDGGVNILSGSTFGGGSTINYLASLKPPVQVRQEWSKLGLPYFASKQFEDDLETAYQKIGATTENIVHSGPNRKLIEGCRNLGYDVQDVPQNTSGRPHNCGKCYTGCKMGVKNSTANSWLKEARSYGAKFLDSSRVKKIETKNGNVVGVICNVHGFQDHFYRAKYVVVAAGSLHSPSLLIQSGLPNPHIGKHLRLHLASLAIGIYDEPIYPSQGSLLTSVSSEFENFDNQHYGFKIECLTQGIGIYSTFASWEGAEKHKEVMLRYQNSVTMFAMGRDKGSKCTIKYDHYGKHVIHFTLSDHDAANLKEGLVQLARIQVAGGARQVYLINHTLAPFKFKDDEISDVQNPRFKAWLNQISQSQPPLPSSGHQMGSCRMGSSPKNSAVKPSGETWDVRNLFVADSSLFPTALGVNPMITIQTLALSVSRNIVEAYKKSQNDLAKL